MIELTSTLTCPTCGGVSSEEMPTNACWFFYDCAHCSAKLRPLAGDCCVFCSYGDVPCPPIQEARATGTSASCC
ncbi:GDCCVxC domain-containing (seleno)protein [Tsuneonella deserti]|uniref:GDCCVxC domain-containing (seleno)protein n=1 Tax=Tsuneonella deserti TaxID=2035528 RepID=UPI0027E5B0EC|nr:GDCCVxC domain-containing (seleno)protein [Tsuneonella deserti]